MKNDNSTSPNKNVWLLPTNKPSSIILHNKDYFYLPDEKNRNNWDRNVIKTVNIYITDDSDIKEGNWAYNGYTNSIHIIDVVGTRNNHWKKIILTTDEELIKDGVQAIPDDFIEWFVNNQICVSVVVEKTNYEMDSKANTHTGNYDFKCPNCNKEEYNVLYSKEPTLCYSCNKYKIIFPNEEDVPYTEAQQKSLELCKKQINDTNEKDLEKTMKEFDNYEINNSHLPKIKEITHRTDYKLVKVTRIEVIDHSKPLEQGGGRAFVKTDCKEVELSYQDDGKTIKIFIK